MGEQPLSYRTVRLSYITFKALHPQKDEYSSEQLSTPHPRGPWPSERPQEAMIKAVNTSGPPNPQQGHSVKSSESLFGVKNSLVPNVSV
jgi:hypothetical protein